jgi:hypothetical protein
VGLSLGATGIILGAAGWAVWNSSLAEVVRDKFFEPQQTEP